MSKVQKELIKEKQEILDNRKPNELYYSVADIEGKTVFLHECIWVYENGLIPDNFLVAHVDGDPGNNNTDNLKLVEENREHGDLHKKENRIFHKSTFNSEFVKKHFSDIYEKILEHGVNVN